VDNGAARPAGDIISEDQQDAHQIVIAVVSLIIGLRRCVARRRLVAPRRMFTPVAALG